MTSILTDPAAKAAFDAYVASNPAHLPWEVQPAFCEHAFMAGWQAREKVCAPLPGVTPGNLAGTHMSATADRAHLVPALTAEEIYKAYPRHVGKQSALKAIDKAARTAGYLDLFKATKAYATATASWPAADKKFIPHPATWFNRGSYDDDPKEWQRGYSATTSQFSQPAATRQS